MRERFDLLYSHGFGWLLRLLFLGPRWSGVDVGPDQIGVRMGWAFRSWIPTASVRSIHRDENTRWWWGIGVHGWRGRWLVNGTVNGIVTLEIGPPAPARVVGFPVELRILHVSLEEPDALVAALGVVGP